MSPQKSKSNLALPLHLRVAIITALTFGSIFAQLQNAEANPKSAKCVALFVTTGKSELPPPIVNRLNFADNNWRDKAPSSELYGRVKLLLERPMAEERIQDFERYKILIEAGKPSKTWLELRELAESNPTPKRLNAKAQQKLIQLRHNLELMQLHRLSQSNTLGKSTVDQTLIGSWYQAERLVETWAKAGQPISAKSIRELHRIVYEHQVSEVKFRLTQGAKAQLSGMMNPFMMFNPFAGALSDKLLEPLAQISAQNKMVRSGEYRTIQVYAGGHLREYIGAMDIPAAMKDLEIWIENNENQLHPIEFAAQVYRRILSIHPFMDGNGRTARLVMDWALLRHGYPPAILSDDNLAAVFARTHPALQKELGDVVLEVASGVLRTQRLIESSF
jgi:hypothetical protein